MPEQPGTSAGSATSGLPTDALKQELQELLKVAGQRVLRSVTSKVGSLGKKVGGAVVEKAAAPVREVGEKITGGDGPAGLAKSVGGGVVKGVAGKAKEAVTGDGGDGGGGGGDFGKVTNIVEHIDVGVPVRVAYDQWTRFTDFPGFMKKVEKVEQDSDTELKWRGQILWSHRDWKSTIIDQVPDKRIVWRSEGSKGYVDGAVTFHELAPDLTRILVVLEYYPQGFFEKTANLWRAQGRRVRLELKHFQRHVMTQTMLHTDELQGWRGEIHDGEVARSPQEAEQSAEQQEQPAEEQPGEEQPAEAEQREPEQPEAGEQAPEQQPEPEPAAQGSTEQKDEQKEESRQAAKA